MIKIHNERSVTKKKIKQKKNELGKNKIFLLNELFQEIYLKNKELDLSKFRVQHKNKIEDLSELEWNRVLCKGKDKDSYYLSAVALPAIDPELTEKLFKKLDIVFAILQSHYEAKQKERITFQYIIDNSELLNISELITLIPILADAGVFSQYPKIESLDTRSKFIVEERVINANSFLDFLLRYEHVTEFWRGIFTRSKDAIKGFVTNKYVYPLLLIFVAEIIRFYVDHMK